MEDCDNEILLKNNQIFSKDSKIEDNYNNTNYTTVIDENNLHPNNDVENGKRKQPGSQVTASAM